jgi:nicotinate-nucleotide--dimethylbenzimidazole phosphoribosyltransferase
MGIGNTSASSLLLAGFSGSSLAECVGPGTGLDPAGVARKLAILEQVRVRSAASPLPSDPVAAAHTMLQRWGGFEIAALIGAIGATVTARAVPLIDGFSVSVAALIADRLAPGVLQRCIFSHCSAEPAHAPLLRRIGVEPLLSLGLRLGEGSGALLALPLLRSSVAFYEQMASFDDAGVSDRPKEDGP